MERMTKANLQERCANLNRRMESAGSMYRYEVSARYNYTAIDRIDTDGRAKNVVRIGTRGEIGEFLHAMMVSLDDASFKTEDRPDVGEAATSAVENLMIRTYGAAQSETTRHQAKCIALTALDAAAKVTA